MATIGPRAAVDLALPTGIDATEILKFALASGTTAEEYLRRVSAAIGAVNEEVVNYFGGLIYITDSLYSYDVQGESTRTMTPKDAEFNQANGVRGSNIGRMLPIPEPYKDALEWTARYLRNAPLGQLDADQTLIVNRWWNRVGYDLWTRILSNTENPVGSAGYDVPWAIGTGTSVNFIPPQKRGGKPFTSSHTHFQVANSSGGGTFATLFLAMIKNLREHGVSGRVQLFVSYDDLDTITALASFAELKPSDQAMISSGTGTDPVRYVVGETNGMPGDLIGFYNTKGYGVAEVRYDERIPTGYCFLTKSYGINNPRNPIAIRTEVEGFGLRPDPQVTRSIVPELDSIFFRASHAVGVNDRVAGVAGLLGAGATTWTNPTLS